MRKRNSGYAGTPERPVESRARGVRLHAVADSGLLGSEEEPGSVDDYESGGERAPDRRSGERLADPGALRDQLTAEGFQRNASQSHGAVGAPR